MSGPRAFRVIAVFAGLTCFAPGARGQWLSPWVEHNGHLYRVTEPLNWFAAESQAVSVGGHLVTINDGVENQWILDTLMPFSSDPVGGLWIGLFQPDGSEEPDGGWEWVSGDALTYTNWMPVNGPNDNRVFGNENAANMWDQSNGPPGTWNDYAADHWIIPAVVEVVPSALIPTVSEWGLVVMTLLLVIAGTMVLKRRWAAQA